jgi:hypothetical protein
MGAQQRLSVQDGNAMKNPLTKTQQQELDSHKQHLEFKVHDGFLAIQNYLFEHHGECTDPACPQSVIKVDANNQNPQQRLRHLAHHPLNAEMVEAALLAGVRKFLDAGICVPMVLHL